MNNTPNEHLPQTLRLTLGLNTILPIPLPIVLYCTTEQRGRGGNLCIGDAAGDRATAARGAGQTLYIYTYIYIYIYIQIYIYIKIYIYRYIDR